MAPHTCVAPAPPDATRDADFPFPPHRAMPAFMFQSVLASAPRQIGRRIGSLADRVSRPRCRIRPRRRGLAAEAAVAGGHPGATLRGPAGHLRRRADGQRGHPVQRLRGADALLGRRARARRHPRSQPGKGASGKRWSTNKYWPPDGLNDLWSMAHDWRPPALTLSLCVMADHQGVLLSTCSDAAAYATLSACLTDRLT